MEEVINGGGSVLHEGKLHTRIDTLPSKASLASSAADRALAASDLDAQIAKLQKDRDDLKLAEKAEAEKKAAEKKEAEKSAKDK